MNTPAQYGHIKKNIKKAIENVQRRATKFISRIKHLPYNERLKQLGIPTLEYRRIRTNMLQTFKILYKYDITSKPDLLTRNLSTCTGGNDLKLFKNMLERKLKKKIIYKSFC